MMRQIPGVARRIIHKMANLAKKIGQKVSGCELGDDMNLEFAANGILEIVKASVAVASVLGAAATRVTESTGMMDGSWRMMDE